MTENKPTMILTEMQKHPLWTAFREAYKKHSEVYPEESGVFVMVVHNWKMFTAGAEAQLQLMQDQLIEDVKRYNEAQTQR